MGDQNQANFLCSPGLEIPRGKHMEASQTYREMQSHKTVKHIKAKIEIRQEKAGPVRVAGILSVGLERLLLANLADYFKG